MAFSASLSSTSTSMAAIPAAQMIGLPLKVVECSPSLSEVIMCSFATVMPIGNPPAKGFARHIMSGMTSQCSQANSLPVRPKLVCTSSKISRIFLSSQIFLRP